MKLFYRQDLTTLGITYRHDFIFEIKNDNSKYVTMTKNHVMACEYVFCIGDLHSENFLYSVKL